MWKFYYNLLLNFILFIQYFPLRHHIYPIDHDIVYLFQKVLNLLLCHIV